MKGLLLALCLLAAGARADEPGDPPSVIQPDADGLVDKVYNLWNRNPVEVQHAYLKSGGSKDAPAAPNMKSF